jgi:isocitrate dehydrogenase
MKQTIIYTQTDEAPALATASLLPVIQAFTQTAAITVETRDISLAGRILAVFPECLTEEQRTGDALQELGETARTPEANIIKLPNISASIPQLQEAIRELQEKGYAVPDYPDNPSSDEERDHKNRYDKVKGSAVNPVLREGNSDRRAPGAVKNYARNHPHTMGSWRSDSKTRVATMTEGDFYGSEQSLINREAGSVRVILKAETGETVLIEKLPLEKGEILDAAVMGREPLRRFLKEALEAAKAEGILFSLHLKATMMKVSDPVIFGHGVFLFFENVFSRHADTFRTLGVDPDKGLADLLSRLEALPMEARVEILTDLQNCLEENAPLAMVDSEKGITNLHVPSDIIIDASMPAAIRNSGKMWGPDGELHDMLAVIPDRCYAGVYQETIDFCKTHGAFDPRTMGSVSNVGLMARKAEEYGSHDKTFIIPRPGTVQVTGEEDRVLLELTVAEGDIFRMCQTKDDAVRDWVKLAVSRARITGHPALFWLDPDRAHDTRITEKVQMYLKDHDITGLDIRILSPRDAARETLVRLKNGLDTISVTGNVLRDYLTDLFPILEVGTSAKMLSVVPLMNGGGLFETGAGGSAPKHVQQFLAEGHLRWDSLGEFLALGASLEHLSLKTGNPRAPVLARTLDKAVEGVLENGKSPSRKVKELDNRGSHFYLALYWARALAAQEEDKELQNRFVPLARRLEEAEPAVLQELAAAQGKPVDIGGYYRPDPALIQKAMRPSETFNSILADWTAQAV